jgi:hypothetical protein
MIRGTLSAVMGMVGNLGMIIYTEVGQITYKSLGPRWVYISLGLMDAAMLIFLTIMILAGKFGQKPKINDGQSDEGSD